MWIDFWDILLPPFYLIVIYAIAFYIKSRNIKKKPHYKYFVFGLSAKIVGAIGVCLIYTQYYNGGDTTNFYESAVTYSNILFNRGITDFIVALNYYENRALALGFFIEGQVGFVSKDHYALFVVDLLTPIVILGMKSYITSSILLAALCYSGLWKLYTVFVETFPDLYKQLSIPILFVPSVVFWSSGMLKDTITFSATGWYMYSVYKVFISEKNARIKYIFFYLISVFLLISIKPYIFFALLPGSIVWVFYSRYSKVKNKYLKMFYFPLILSLIGISVVVLMQSLGDYLGEYSADKVLTKAVVTQQDLSSDRYGANGYDIGKFDASFSGVISKAPIAINVALFKPYLWEARNAVMLVSGLENFIILAVSIYIIIKVGVFSTFNYMFSSPVIVFSFLFAIFFAFAVGLTTANYGALVRLRIPCVPFYVVTMILVYSTYKKDRIRQIKKKLY